MSSPPPGYNAGESMLEGGTATITPVMGGGMLRNAMKQMRKKHTKRGRRAKNKTKRIRRKRSAQTGGVGHYNVFDVDTLAVPPGAKEVSTSLSMLPTTPMRPPAVNLNVLVPEYLIEQAALWTRDITSAFLGATVTVPILPNSSNVTCSMLSSIKFAPDRLCCILPKTTTAISVFPAVNGDPSTFNLIAQAIENDINNSTTPKNRVYIFSPPFYGRNPTTNSILFNNFLHYRNIGKDPERAWSFYILTEQSNLNTKAAVDVKPLIDPKDYDMTAYRPTGNQVPLKTLMASLYTLLEPTYIIYPYTVKIISIAYDSAGNPISTGTPADSNAASAKVNLAEDKYNTAKDVAVQAKARVGDLNAKYQAAAVQVLKADEALVAAKAARVGPNSAVVNAQNKITTDTAILNTYANPSSDRTKLQAVIDNENEILVTLKETLAEADANFTKASDAYGGVSKAANKLNEQLKAAKGASTKADAAVRRARAAADSAVKQPAKPIAIPDADERGGILFSASTKGEAILPAPNRGFNGPINYLQKNNPRGSLAYKPNLPVKEPQLNALDLQEYNLFQQPLMSKQQMFTIILQQATPVADTKISTDQRAFLGSPGAVQNNIPLVAVAVNSQEYSIRSPLPDVINDWNNAVYSDEEAEYLNALQVSPSILNAIFPNTWKRELTEHLSAISRSKCFTDSRLILNSECQKAQEFISKILNYFMSNSSSILQLQGKQQDAYVSRLKASADAAINAATAQTYSEDANIFDPAQFVQAFFPGTGTQYLLSISSVKVMRNDKKYTVMYEGDMGLAEKQGIEEKTQPFTVAPLGEEGTYIWTFPEAQDEHMLKLNAKVYIPSFKVGGTYNNTIPGTSYTVTYRGKMSGSDKTLIESKIGAYTEEPRTDGPNPNNMCYTWTLTKSTTQDGLHTALSSIKNGNIYNCQFTQENQLDYDSLTPVIPNIDVVNKRLEKIVLLLDLSNPKIPMAAKFSSDYNPNGEIKPSITTMKQVYARVKDSLPTKFGGKYVIIS